MILKVMYEWAEYVAHVVLKPYAYIRLARIPGNVSRLEEMSKE